MASASRVEALGAWLFARRGWLPVPLLLILLLVGPSRWAEGLAVMAVGETVRLAAVGHIGLPSRTVGAEVGPLVASGPYAWVRNPLYVGNLLLWVGLGIVAWPSVFAVVPLLLVYYAAIVRWEEANLAEKLGAPYLAYRNAVPRWLPRPPRAAGPARWGGARALRAERGTFVSLALVLLALLVRAGL